MSICLINDNAINSDARNLIRIKAQPHEIWMVKFADRITNLQPPPNEWTEEKIRKYKEESIEIYGSLKDASPFLADRLDGKIKSYKCLGAT